MTSQREPETLRRHDARVDDFSSLSDFDCTHVTADTVRLLHCRLEMGFDNDGHKP